jgi:hypothetical protein
METVKIKSGVFPQIQKWCEENIPSYLDGSFSIFEFENEDLDMPLLVERFLFKIAEANPEASLIIFI